MIAIFVNGSHLSIDAGTDVSGLVDALGIARKGVAVAVNDEVVPRSLWLTSLTLHCVF